MPSFYDNVRTAGDVGMFAQTFLLSLAAHGLAGVPQTYLGFHAEPARKVLGIDPALKMSGFRMDRAPLGEIVTFHR
jgi:hypothetical protein